MALNFLLSKGYTLLSRNFNTRFGEIDLVMKDKDEMVFVEVKTKKGPLFGTPEEMFTRRKYRKVKNMGILYLNGRETKCRIDMVAIDLWLSPPSLRHYQNVVL